MAHKTKNTYKVTFNDGTSFESSGGSESDFKELSINDEFKWLGFHISKEIVAFGKHESDITKIEFTLLNDKE